MGLVHIFVSEYNVAFGVEPKFFFHISFSQSLEKCAFFGKIGHVYKSP